MCCNLQLYSGHVLNWYTCAKVLELVYILIPCKKAFIFLLSFVYSFHDAMKRFTLVSRLRGLSTPTLPPHIPLSSTQPLTPPHSLLDYPPLANLTNTLIQAFNDLRQCAPLALGPEISQELRRLLESTVHDVGEFHK